MKITRNPDEKKRRVNDTLSMTSTTQHFAEDYFASTNQLDLTATGMFTNESHIVAQEGDKIATGPGLLLADPDAYRRYAQVLEEYARFFELADCKPPGTEETSDKEKESDLSTADAASNSSVGITEKRGVNIALKLSIDSIQAFTGVRKCLSYERIRRCGKCSGENPLRCKACKSTGILRQPTQLSLPIPSQVRDGVLLRLRNRGHEALDGESGDLIVQINVREHERYSRQSYDLHCKQQISFTKAILGGAVAVETLDDVRDVVLQPGTTHNEQHTLKGLGLQQPDGSRGNLVVTFEIVIPTQMTDEQKKAIECFAEMESTRDDSQ